MHMRRRVLYRRAAGIITVLLTFALMVVVAPSAAEAATGGSDTGVPATIPGVPAGSPDAPVAVSVILSQTAVLTAPQSLRAAAASAVESEQSSFTAQAKALDPSVKLVSSQSQLLNRVTVTVPRRLLGRLQALPGVTRVVPEQVYHATQDVAPVQIDAVAAAEASPALDNSFANAGRGIKIGIVDDGVDATTPFLTDTATPSLGIPGFSTPMPQGFPKGTTTIDGAPGTT